MGDGHKTGDPAKIIIVALCSRRMSPVFLSTSADSAAAASVKRALNYLSRQGIAIDEPYLLASYALVAMAAGDSSRAAPVIAKLRRLALSEGATTFWALETNTPFYGWGLAGRVETTAVVVQALTRYCDSENANCDADRKLIMQMPCGW